MIGHCGQWGPASPGHCCIIGDGVVIIAPHSLPQCNCGSRIKWFTLLENLFYSISSVQFKPLQQYLGTVWVHCTLHRGLSQLLIPTQYNPLSLPCNQMSNSPNWATNTNISLTTVCTSHEFIIWSYLIKIWLRPSSRVAKRGCQSLCEDFILVESLYLNCLQ